jgi:GntR family transcriptional repressor for pyruvate dehydrogenase complex
MQVNGAIHLEQPERLKLSEQIAQQILGQIADGTLRPGDRLPTENQLLEQLGVGRSTLREALRSLSGMGLLDIRHGQGVFVAMDASHVGLRQLDWALLLGSREMLNLVEARKVLEIQIAALAAERATPADLERMAACLQDMRSARVRQTLQEADVAFHLALAEASQNDVFVHIIRTIRELVRRMLWQSPATRAGRVTEHERILRAVRAGDAEAATQAMRDHFHETEERARAVLQGATAPRARTLARGVDDHARAATMRPRASSGHQMTR